MLRVDRQTDGWTDGQTYRRTFLMHLKTATVTEEWDAILTGNACARGIRSEVNLAVGVL